MKIFKNAGYRTSIRKNKGAISLEYILVIVLVALVALGAMRIFGNKVGSTITDSANAVDRITNNVFNQLDNTASGGITGIEADGSVLINETNFPDATFRTYVATNFDTDSDGKLALDERDAVTRIEVSGKNITSLKGIEYFTEIILLEAAHNQLTTLDVSNNKNLVRFNCAANQITSLRLPETTTLTQIYCHNNRLTTLDVSKNEKLGNLTVSSNLLTSIDVSNNPKLELFDCSDNQLTTLDISNNTKLTEFGCSNNYLTSLNISNNTRLTDLNCSNNQLTTLDVSNNIGLTDLKLANNLITTLDVSHNTQLGRYLGQLDIRSTGITELDLSNCPSLNSSNVKTDGAVTITYAS